ncbi:MAG: DUF1501 domain-containing protein [Pirellulaceae bacterium]|nr:DUF1501 domain-containing protein [Pirellulaceae bacterium]
MSAPLPYSCGSADHLTRRTLLQAAGATGLCWLTPLAERLARAAEDAPRGKPAKSLIVLWMAGGPSQLETFDPHPKSPIAHEETKAIDTRAKGIQIADSLPLIAEQMDHISLVRSLVSKEGDHERATYTVKTGFRPDPTLIHPSLGSILCHQTTDNCEIPRHVSILPGQWPARGGFLGDQFDAFKTFDPNGPIPDVIPRVPEARATRRLDALQNVVESSFARGRLKDLDKKTLHATSIAAARKMMSSDQLKAFDVSLAPESLRQEFGDNRFGRGCLAALQLIGVGVRCVEVTLDGWDTHFENERSVRANCAQLDPAFAALLKHLKERELLDSTIVLWAGEFGRTPRRNPNNGRDHWPHGFTVALGGGGIRGGRVIGETSPDPKLSETDRLQDLTDPHNIDDIHATVLRALGIDFTVEHMTPIGRPMALSKGKVIDELLA